MTQQTNRMEKAFVIGLIPSDNKFLCFSSAVNYDEIHFDDISSDLLLIFDTEEEADTFILEKQKRLNALVLSIVKIYIQV